MAIFKTAGDDFEQGLFLNDLIYGGPTTVPSSDTGADALSGGGGRDTIYGFGGNDALFGDSALGPNPMFLGVDSGDRLFGGDGDDTIVGQGGADVLSGGADNDLLLDGAIPASLVALDPDQFADLTYESNAAADNLMGGTGDDILASLGGADTLNGGGGLDIALIGRKAASAALTFVASLAPGGATMSDGTVVIDVERFAIEGGAGGDSFTVLGRDDGLRGNGGNDTLFGGGGNDVLGGDGGVDSLVGGAGDDLLIGGAGSDRLIGGLDNDTIQVGTSHGRDVVYGFDTQGNDVVSLDLGVAMDSFAEVQAALREDGGDVVLDTSGTSSIRFRSATLADFGIDDFLFL